MQSDASKLIATARALSLSATLATILLALAVIAGWLFEVEHLQSFKPITATALLFSALSLLTLHKEKPRTWRVWLGVVLAFSATLIAGLDLSQFAWHWGFRWDTVISDHLLNGEDFAFFGGMSPNDAVVVAILSTALLALSIPSKVCEILSQLLCIGALLAGMMTILGCIFGVADFCLFISCLRISVLSGLCMTLLSIGILLSRPLSPLTAVLVSPDAGGMIARILFPAALGIPPLLGWLRVLGEHCKVFNTETSLPVFMVVMLLIFMSLIWWMSCKLDNSDRARKQTMLQLAASEKRNRLTVQQAIDAFIAVDNAGTIKDWNYRAEKIFGLSREEALGKSLIDLAVPESLRAQAKLEFQQFVLAGKALERPVEFSAIDSVGREFPIELSAFPIQVDGEVVLCGFARDITERKLVEQRFHDFYSNISHELRSPITSISGSMKLLEALFGAVLTEKGNRLVQVAENNCQRLIRLVNDLLDIRKIEAGRLALKMHPCDATELARAAVEGMEGLAARAGVTLSLEPSQTARIVVDWDRLIQVLTNLISNAVKYSPSGQTVIVRIENMENKIRFAIVDRGPGIAKTDQARLFNKFEQVGSDHQKPGTGLGLVIARAIVEEHGGTVGIISDTGAGSTFWCDIPLASSGQAAESAPNKDSAAPDEQSRGQESETASADEPLVKEPM